MIYPFNARVYLRCDPSHYGRILRGPYPYNEIGDNLGSDFFQFVRWEQNGSSHVTHENVAGLMGEQEYYERRRLFIHAMRQPEMRLVRLALRHLCERGVDWRQMSEIELYRYGYRNDCCMILCGAYMLVCLDALNPDITYEDFFFVWLHQESDPECKCEFCETERKMSA